MNFMDYDLKPLIWRTSEFLNGTIDDIEFFLSTQEQQRRLARKVLRKYIDKECPMKCLFCHYVESIEFDDVKTTCGGTGEEVSPNGFCHLFTPDDDVYELQGVA